MVSVGTIKALGSYNMASCDLRKKNQDQTCRDLKILFLTVNGPVKVN